jgi:tetratricopeptide (TPR) repeat protein
MALHNHSYRLSNLGRYDEALPGIAEAIALYRKLAAADPETFAPDLAEALYDLSVPLAALGQREEAQSAITETVALYAPLVSTDPESYSDDYEKAVEQQRRLRVT